MRPEGFSYLNDVGLSNVMGSRVLSLMCCHFPAVDHVKLDVLEM